MVLESTTTVPLVRPSIAPPGPNSTACTALVSDTQTHTASLSLAASAGVAAVVAPSTSRGVRFQTVTSCPAFTRLAAMGRPIIPRPKKATRMLGIKRSQAGCRQVGPSNQPSAVQHSALQQEAVSAPPQRTQRPQRKNQKFNLVFPLRPSRPLR